jgi:hypothetical protein
VRDHQWFFVVGDQRRSHVFGAHTQGAFIVRLTRACASTTPIIPSSTCNAHHQRATHSSLIGSIEYRSFLLLSDERTNAQICEAYTCGCKTNLRDVVYSMFSAGSIIDRINFGPIESMMGIKYTHTCTHTCVFSQNMREVYRDGPMCAMHAPPMHTWPS